MSMETIVLSLIVLAFGIFAVTLYWADMQTRELSK